MDIEKLSFRVKDEKNEDVIVQIDARLADMSQPIDESDKSEVIPLLQLLFRAIKQNRIRNKQRQSYEKSGGEKLSVFF